VCISGRREEALEQKEEKAVHSQRRSKHIFRLLDLPSEIDLDGVKATVREGLLDPALGKFISESEEFVGVHVFQDRESSTSTLGRDRV
jgi:HSP20 family molecular chaperone IbpA